MTSRLRTAALVVSGFLAGAVFFSLAAFAWTGPTSAAPNGNVSPPINVGTTDQVKNAGLSVNALAVFGNSILSGGSYLNFGSTPGSGGYGIRDNAGTMEFRNSSGAWAGIASSSGVTTETDPQVGTLTSGRWCTTDGTTITCASTPPTGGITAVTTVSCTPAGGITTATCVATCPAGYFRTGCSPGLGSGTGHAAFPSGANGCTGANYTTIYAYCAK